MREEGEEINHAELDKLRKLTKREDRNIFDPRLFDDEDDKAALREMEIEQRKKREKAKRNLENAKPGTLMDTLLKEDTKEFETFRRDNDGTNLYNLRKARDMDKSLNKKIDQKEKEN